YEEALSIINRHQNAVGETKLTSIKRLLVYNRMGNFARAAVLTKELFAKYPDDEEIREGYVKVLLDDAKTKMTDEKYADAIADWNKVKEYGDEQSYKIAQAGIYNAYMAMKDYTNALNALNILMDDDPDEVKLYTQRADIYQKQGRYDMALASYAQAVERADEDQKQKYIDGYGEMLTVMIKELNEQYRYEEAMDYVKMWLEKDPHNYQALKYAVNLSHQLNDIDKMKYYATIGNEFY